MKIVFVIVSALLIMMGCSTNPISAYENVPDTCHGIEDEIHVLAEKDSKVLMARSVKEGAIMSVSLAGAAGLVPAGWVYLPLAASLAGQFKLPTHGRRLEHLARVYEIRGCWND